MDRCKVRGRGWRMFCLPNFLLLSPTPIQNHFSNDLSICYRRIILWIESEFKVAQFVIRLRFKCVIVLRLPYSLSGVFSYKPLILLIRVGYPQTKRTWGDREGHWGRWLWYVIVTKVIFSFRKSVFPDVRTDYNLVLRFLVKIKSKFQW